MHDRHFAICGGECTGCTAIWDLPGEGGAEREEKDRELMLLLATARRGEAKGPRRAFQFGWDDPHRLIALLALLD